jgi:hypothetical protein
MSVTDGKAGRVLRVDPDSGAVSTFASGLPPASDAVAIGGATDVAFLGHTAYVLVTLVGRFFGPADVVDGIYRIEPDGRATAVADVGDVVGAVPSGRGVRGGDRRAICAPAPSREPSRH